MVTAIEPAVRFYEEPPTEGDGRSRPRGPTSGSAPTTGPRRSTSPDPGTPHNEARDQVWDELLTILVDKHERRRRPRRPAPPVAARRTPSCVAPQPGLAAARGGRPGRRPVVGAGLPAACARPGSSPDEVRLLQRADPQAWTVSDLPLLDAARQRLGDPEASRRRRRHEAAVAAEREQMAQVVDDLIATDDSEMHVMSMLRGDDLRDALVDEAALPERRPGPARRTVRAHRGRRGPGADRRGVADAAAPLPVAQLHHRRATAPRPGTGSPSRGRSGSSGSGSTGSTLASLSINYRTPEEVMAEAEPVIRAALPDANVPTSIRSSGVPVVHGSAADLDAIVDDLARGARRRDRLRDRRPDVRGRRPRVRSLTPELVEGARVRPGRPRRPGGVRRRASRGRSTATSR